MSRRLALGTALVALIACSSPGARKPAGGGRLVAPGLRLPDDAAPIAYDLHLDLDPEKPTFGGHVVIRAKLLKPSDHVWLSADRLSLGAATWKTDTASGSLALDPVVGDEMRAFRFGRELPAGEVTLDLMFTGTLDDDAEEGLFRQRATGGGWYVFSQGESVFARRWTPCFDEPRFKTPWRVTLTVPKTDAALSNTVETSTRALPDGRNEVTFAETASLPSYLVAIAVGPFEIVNVGTLGRGKVPVRVIVPKGEGRRTGVVAAKLPRVIDALETYLEEALPLAKLDLVAVPHLFGAMENPGLITFDQPMLLGDPMQTDFANNFVLVAAHELAHQWFGNSVTPAWWDDLWLSEGFASWLGSKVELQLGAIRDPELRAAITRREAIAADTGSAAAPLRRPMLHNADPDNSFDEIAYQKAQVVLTTFEDFLGADTFRKVLRAYLDAHRGATATTADFVGALRKTTDEVTANAFDQYVRLTGVPIVELTKSCDGTEKKVIAHARDGRIVPVCVQYELKRPASECHLVSERTEFTVGEGCNVTVGNAKAGYYHTAWLTDGPIGPLHAISKAQARDRVVLGDDVAARIQRGELSAAAAISQLKLFLDASDVYSVLGGIAIARALDRLVSDAERAAWSAWLGKHLQGLNASPEQISRSSGEIVEEFEHARVELAPTSFTASVVHDAQVELDRLLMVMDIPPLLVALVAPIGGDQLFARIADRAKVATPENREDFYTALGMFGPAQAPAAVALLSDASISIDDAWLAVEQMLQRPATRTAAWRALRPVVPAVMKRLGDDAHELIDALGSLCDKTSRDEVAKTVANSDSAVAAIDRCIASRAKLGDLASALR